jgi:prepilin-type N-terminal cleavage/methylation domain-containing protein
MNQRTSRNGFTLVELLAVIVIIGILVALITPAVFNARLKAQKAQILSEIGQLDAAMSRLASEGGNAFPPDFTSFNLNDNSQVQAFFNGEMKRYMAKRFPRYKGQNIQGAISNLYATNPSGTPAQQWRKVNAADFDPRRLDPAEAIVFWLGGFSIAPGEDSTKLRGFSANASLPFEGPAQTKRINGLYEFNEERLVDRDRDGWYEYVPSGNIGAGNGPPYVYFNSRSYANLVIDNNGTLDPNKAPMVRYPKADSTQEPLWGFATPYRSSEGPKAWVNPKKFQILSASLDGTYGNTVAATQGPKAFPGGDKYETADLDNLTNFWPESDLEGKKP